MNFFFTRKGAALTALSLALTATLQAQTITSEGEAKTIMLRDLKVSAGNVITEYTQGETSFKISGEHITEDLTADYLIDCLDPSTPVKSAIYVADSETSQTDNKEHSFLLIENKGKNPITSIDFVGICSTTENESSLVCAISDETQSFYAPEEGGQFVYARQEGRASTATYVSQTLNFSGDDRLACNYSFEIPSTIYKINRKGWATEATINNVEESTKFIRLDWSTDGFAGLAVSQRGKPMLLLGLVIHIIDKTPVGIPQEETTLTVNRIAEGVFSLSSQAEITVYSMNGSIVTRDNSTDTFSLQGQAKGVYILKAKAGNETVTKKIVY